MIKSIGQKVIGVTTTTNGQSFWLKVGCVYCVILQKKWFSFGAGK